LGPGHNAAIIDSTPEGLILKTTVIRLHRTGGPEVLQSEDIELPAPGWGEVTIRHTAIGLNFQDIYTRSGAYPCALPTGLGTEAAGVIEALGPGVTGFSVGDRVCCAGGSTLGAYAVHRNQPANRLVKSPDFMTDEQLAAILLKGMTVEYLMQRCFAVQPDQFVLMHAAAGGVGLLAGQWGRHLGARMIGVAGSPDKVALAQQNGYEFCINRQTEDIAARVREITSNVGVPVVYDSVGKDSFEASLASLAPRGYFVSFGATSGLPPPVPAPTLQKLGSLYFTRPTLSTYTADPADLQRSAAAVFDLCQRSVLNVSIQQRYRWSEIARAHAELESGMTSGSSVLLP
jgi:NADPH2:quinone reductase